MTMRDDDVRVRPRRINHGNRGAKRPKTFVGEVMRAAKRAGHVGDSFRSSQGRSRSRFGRGRTHHLQFADLEFAGDTAPGAIVEARAYEVVPHLGWCRRKCRDNSSVQVHHETANADVVCLHHK